MDDYKPLTDEQIYAIQDTNVDVFYVTPTAFRAIEQAAIKNYLAQRKPADEWLLTLRSLLNDLIVHAQANGLEIGRAGTVSESTAQVGFRLAGILEHAKRFVFTPPAPQDAQAGKDAERYQFIRDADRCDVDMPFETLLAYAGESLDAAIDAAIAAAKGKE